METLKLTKKKGASGISLVALVITIIVLIILTAAVILTFMEGGIIDKAKEAVFKSDMKTYQEQLVMAKAKQQIDVEMGKVADYDFSEIEESIKEEYANVIEIGEDGNIYMSST